MTSPLWKSDASPLRWASAVDLSIGYPTAGDLVTNTPPTRVGGTWCQGMADEIRNVIDAAGLIFDPTDTTQFYQAIVILLGSTYRNAILVESGEYLLTESGERIYL